MHAKQATSSFGVRHYPSASDSSLRRANDRDRPNTPTATRSGSANISAAMVPNATLIRPQKAAMLQYQRNTIVEQSPKRARSPKMAVRRDARAGLGYSAPGAGAASVFTTTHHKHNADNVRFVRSESPQQRPKIARQAANASTAWPAPIRVPLTPSRHTTPTSAATRSVIHSPSHDELTFRRAKGLGAIDSNTCYYFDAKASRQTAGHKSVIPQPKCWLCEMPQRAMGWGPDTPAILGEARRASDLTPDATDKGQLVPLSLLTLCPMCSQGVSLGAEATTADVVNKGQGTFACRSRSIPFVGYLREYKLLLEVLALEAAEAASQYNSSTSDEDDADRGESYAIRHQRKQLNRSTRRHDQCKPRPLPRYLLTNLLTQLLHCVVDALQVISKASERVILLDELAYLDPTLRAAVAKEMVGLVKAAKESSTITTNINNREESGAVVGEGRRSTRSRSPNVVRQAGTRAGGYTPSIYNNASAIDTGEDGMDAMSVEDEEADVGYQHGRQQYSSHNGHEKALHRSSLLVAELQTQNESLRARVAVLERQQLEHMASADGRNIMHFPASHQAAFDAHLAVCNTLLTTTTSQFANALHKKYKFLYQEVSRLMAKSKVEGREADIPVVRAKISLEGDRLYRDDIYGSNTQPYGGSRELAAMQRTVPKERRIESLPRDTSVSLSPARTATRESSPSAEDFFGGASGATPTLTTGREDTYAITMDKPRKGGPRVIRHTAREELISSDHQLLSSSAGTMPPSTPLGETVAFSANNEGRSYSTALLQAADYDQEYAEDEAIDGMWNPFGRNANEVSIGHAAKGSLFSPGH